MEVASWKWPFRGRKGYPKRFEQLRPSKIGHLIVFGPKSAAPSLRGSLLRAAYNLNNCGKGMVVVGFPQFFVARRIC